MPTAGKAIFPLRSGFTCSITFVCRVETESRKDVRRPRAFSQRCTPNRKSSAERGGGGGFCVAALPERADGCAGLAPGGDPIFIGGGSAGACSAPGCRGRCGRTTRAGGSTG